MQRPILFLHRWLGVIVGLLMTVWCLSGFVMMYVDYPRLLPNEQLRGLTPLQLPSPERLASLAIPDGTALSSARIEMMADRPVLRIVPGIDMRHPVAQMRIIPGAYDLATGRPLELLGEDDARAIAAAFARHTGIDGTVETVRNAPMDQWTVQLFRSNAPLYRAIFNDGVGTEIYVSGKTGEVVQQTTRFERFWGWLGAVPHWLYPTILRQNGELWSQTVIWTSLAGCFLAATGLWAGVARLRRKRDGKIGSPFNGIWWWHHVYGLFFGLLTLTWVASGLFSMNPWGFLGSMAGFAEREQLAGSMTWQSARSALAAQKELPLDVVRLETAPLGGVVHVAALGNDGRSTRFSADGRRSPLRESELRAALAAGKLHPGALTLLTSEDSYYYSHKFPAPLPVWRAALEDEERTLLYMDPDTGQIVRAFDRAGRQFRWLQDGLHSLDFPILRKRPVWDLVVIPLLVMVTVVCATGTWMGWSRARRDLRGWRRRAMRRRGAARNSRE